MRSYKQQAIALADGGGADAMVVETMSDLDEAKAAGSCLFRIDIQL
jgi:methionine synthase I (cobalamin-dependent)